jgi:UDP-2,4-diacetamido-2,4,6-trideoxy-beta-L-altropyranose hydrolase
MVWDDNAWERFHLTSDRSSPRVLFLPDAGARVGGGHVMRCLTLAGALGERGAACAFAVGPEGARLVEAFAPPGIERLPGADDDADRAVAAGLAAVAGWRATWLVVDHYGVSARQEARLRAAAGRLLALDDLKRTHDADLVLDSNLGRTAGDYPGQEVLAGPAFTLVRPAFRAQREEALARRARQGGVERVLVAMGLTDLMAITARVLEALQPALGARQVDVVLGAGAAGLEEARALAAEDRRLRIHIDTQAMAELTAAADLAVGAGGSSTWERCCLGLPTLTVILADNQRANAEVLAAAGAAVALEASDPDFPAKLAAAFTGLCANGERRRAMGAAAAALCDGLGAEMVAARMLG